MSKIVGVHGIGHQFSGAHTLRNEWLPALQDGLERAGCKLESPDDFACAFYGDLFRPAGKAAMLPAYDESDVTDPWEQDLLAEWWREAARIDPRVRAPGANTKAYAPDVVQKALRALSQSPFFADIAESVLIFDLKQVRRYLNEPDVRHAARECVKQAISPQTRVVVAHSLGSVIAYEALCAHPASQVDVFVTLGSPLGIRNLIFDKLDPGPQAGLGMWPPGVKHWVNIADSGDVVALVKDLGAGFGPNVVNRSVANNALAHDAKRYLTSRELGEAVALGL